jgi:hypothetical protein
VERRKKKFACFEFSQFTHCSVFIPLKNIPRSTDVVVPRDDPVNRFPDHVDVNRFPVDVVLVLDDAGEVPRFLVVLELVEIQEGNVLRIRGRILQLSEQLHEGDLLALAKQLNKCYFFCSQFQLDKFTLVI